MNIGDRFGRLVVIDLLPQRKARVVCDCGKKNTPYRSNLTRGFTKSCGCFEREQTQLGKNLRHGFFGTPEYRAWAQALQRCTNPKLKNYSDYGGRGIKVCARWRSFSNFIADMGVKPSPVHSLDRIDNDGPYAPWNCRWATLTEQRANRRDSRL